MLRCSAACSSLQLHRLHPPGSLFMGFARQEYWSGVPFPTPGDPPNPGSNPMSLVSPVLGLGSLPLVPPAEMYPNILTPGKYQLPNIVNVLNATEFCTLKGFTFCFVNFTQIFNNCAFISDCGIQPFVFTLHPSLKARTLRGSTEASPLGGEGSS